jgi:hypothetical protein
VNLSITVEDRARDDIGQSRFARACPARDQQIVAAANRVRELLRLLGSKHSPFDQIVYRKVARGLVLPWL